MASSVHFERVANTLVAEKEASEEIVAKWVAVVDEVSTVERRAC